MGRRLRGWGPTCRGQALRRHLAQLALWEPLAGSCPLTAVRWLLPAQEWRPTWAPAWQLRPPGGQSSPHKARALQPTLTVLWGALLPESPPETQPCPSVPLTSLPAHQQFPTLGASPPGWGTPGHPPSSGWAPEAQDARVPLRQELTPPTCLQLSLLRGPTRTMGKEQV